MLQARRTREKESKNRTAGEASQKSGGDKERKGRETGGDESKRSGGEEGRRTGGDISAEGQKGRTGVQMPNLHNEAFK